MRPAAAVAASLAFAAAGCASAGGGDDLQAVVGCYQFEVSADTRALGLPWGLELFDAPLQGWPSLPEAHEAATRLTAAERADHPFGFWESAAADSIRVGHPGGGGFVLLLAAEGQDLVGRGRAVGDALALGQAPGAGPDHPVVARRVLCPEVGGD